MKEEENLIISHKEALMSNSYICKDCNYESETEGLCPYCDMPMEPISGVDETTGEAVYKNKEIDEVEKATEGKIEYSPINNEEDEELLEDEEIDKIIENE